MRHIKSMGLIKKTYDANYFENIFYREKPNSQRNRNRIRELLKHKNSGKLLEIGCGEGNFIKMAERYFSVSGIDISEYALSKAKKLFGDKVNIGNVETINLQPNYYDVIVAFNLLEHLKNPKKVIEKLYSALKKDGILIGSVPNNFGILGSLATLISNLTDKTHCSTFAPRVWRGYFESAGFEKIFFFGETQFTRNISFYVKNKFWQWLCFNLMFICKKYKIASCQTTHRI